jgi:hypothetical protein
MTIRCEQCDEPIEQCDCTRPCLPGEALHYDHGESSDVSDGQQIFLDGKWVAVTPDLIASARP